MHARAHTCTQSQSPPTTLCTKYNHTDPHHLLFFLPPLQEKSHFVNYYFSDSPCHCLICPHLLLLLQIFTVECCRKSLSSCIDTPINYSRYTAVLIWITSHFTPTPYCHVWRGFMCVEALAADEGPWASVMQGRISVGYIPHHIAGHPSCAVALVATPKGQLSMPFIRLSLYTRHGANRVHWTAPVSLPSWWSRQHVHASRSRSGAFSILRFRKITFL